MNIKMKVTSFLWAALYLVQPLSAQQGITTSGGDVISPEGSVSYSIGQIAFGSFAGESGYVQQGLQQPYQFNTVGTQDIYWGSIFSLYPNPANQNIYLHLSADENMLREMDLYARVYDMAGNLILTQKLKNDVNSIWIDMLPAAVYVIQIWQAKTFLQSVSFSKTN